MIGAIAEEVRRNDDYGGDIICDDTGLIWTAMTRRTKWTDATGTAKDNERTMRTERRMQIGNG